MTMHTRRSFLAQSALGVSSAWLASNWSGILDARAYAEQAASGAAPALSFFTSEQAADIDAMASQIIPTDDTPGAHEARMRLLYRSRPDNPFPRQPARLHCGARRPSGKDEGTFS